MKAGNRLIYSVNKSIGGRHYERKQNNEDIADNINGSFNGDAVYAGNGGGSQP